MLFCFSVWSWGQKPGCGTCRASAKPFSCTTTLEIYHSNLSSCFQMNEEWKVVFSVKVEETINFSVSLHHTNFLLLGVTRNHYY